MNKLQVLLINEMKRQFGSDFYVPEFSSEKETRKFIQDNIERFAWYSPEGFEDFSEQEICFELGIESLLDILDFEFTSDGNDDYELDDECWDDIEFSPFYDYLNRYEPGDDFEEDWIRSLE